MTPIFEEINRALADVHMSTGKPATTIYLGYKQYRLLQEALAKDYYYYVGKAITSLAPMYLGCTIYEVNDNDHCAAR